MARSLKPLHEQVIVITGASSGIGLATTIMAAASGAKLVLNARSEETLRELAADIRAAGGQATHLSGDVGRPDVAIKLAQKAIARFGHIDTWINNAGVSIYGRITQTSDADNRRLFDTNFWGTVYGAKAALPHLATTGGALINVGSEVSDAVVPLQGMYSASKHAVKGFTDALRVELEHDKVAVTVSLIQPGATDTPFPQHARNYMDKEPALPTPLDDPFHVAEKILEAATHERRSIKVSNAAKLNVMMAKFAPALADKMGVKQMDRQTYDEPARNPAGALHSPTVSGKIFGDGGPRA